ncbi:hypothetical protein ACFQYP_08975 [Nonomuraea antimicrobica]
MALVAATAAIAVPLLTGTDKPAYAVSTKADGTVRVEINEFEEADRLEADLAKAGVKADISYVPAGKQCEVGRGKAIGQALAGQPRDAAVWMSDGGVDIDPRHIGADQTLVLEFAGHVQETAEAKESRVLWRLTGQLVTGPVAPCTVIDDPSWKGDAGS